MKRPTFLSASLLMAFGALATPARAHFLWATLDPTAKTVSAGLQEIPSESPLPLASRAAKVKAWTPSAAAVPLAADGNWLRGTTDAPAVGVSLDYGVLDRRGEGRGQFWLKYYAKAATSVTASQTSVGLPVELTATPGKDGTMITVLKDGKPFEGAEIVVEAADGKTAFEGKSSALGTVVLPRLSAPLAVRALVTEDVKGTEGGVAYDLVRSYSTLNIGQAAPAPTTLSRRLHDSFGNNHDVVSHSGFIETVMANKLTKAQLIDHLRQREFVHAAVDRILSGASGVPYGADQKAVLALLRENLTALGAGPITPTQEWPLTKAFVDEIEASAKEGPYFALGVFHVYYGGITNGGRDIGAMIADQTGFSPTYYLKSDGYPAYVQALNAKVTDPEAEKAMIRGGQAAYRYIIAVNNEDAFKGK